MKAQTFMLWKRSGGYGDALAAIGLARLLYVLTGQNPLVREEPGAFAVVLPEPVDLDALDYGRLRHNPGYRYVRLKADDDQAPESDFLDYEKERARYVAWRDLRKKARAGRALSDEERRQLEAAQPRSDWGLWQSLNVLQALGTYNKLHAAIRDAHPQELVEAVKAKLAAMAQGMPVWTVDTAFSPVVSAVQAFNPTVGKGINRPKPDGAPVANLPKTYADWFEEYLRYLGVEAGLCAYGLGEDYKFLAVVPGRVDAAVLEQVLIREFRALSQRFRYGSILLDIQSALELAKLLLHHVEAGDWTPRDVIRGVQAAYFKSLGSGRALMNLSFIGLPGWFPVRTADDVEAWMNLLEEHLRLVRALDEEKAEEAELLEAYRDFVSGGDWRALLLFFAGYGMTLFRARERAAQRAASMPSPKQSLLEVLVVKGYPHYAKIVRNPGFQAIAKAMRLATVAEQYHKARGQQVFAIHYDLFQKLKQHARFPEQLLAIVMDFVAEYNRENARREEQLARKGQGGRRRPNITTGEVEQFVALFDAHRQHSEALALLLIAYASSREDRTAEGEAAVEAATGEAADDADVYTVPIDEA
ncbi:MAG TPA: hypothetical protein VIK75_02960 [Calditerricola sp.]